MLHDLRSLISPALSIVQILLQADKIVLVAQSKAETTWTRRITSRFRAGFDSIPVLICAEMMDAGTRGVNVGMAVTKAQALVPGLVVIDSDPAGDREGLDKLETRINLARLVIS